MKVFLIGIGGGLGLHVAQQLTARGERGMDEAFEHYMVANKHAESELGLTDLDRIILRASALTNESGKGRADYDRGTAAAARDPPHHPGSYNRNPSD